MPSLVFHPASPFRPTAKQIADAEAVGYSWLAAIASDGKSARTLVFAKGLIERLEHGHVDYPIYQITDLSKV